MDLGGDKFASHLPIPYEVNPFMGFRAIRFCLRRLDVFRVQLRAILRSAAYARGLRGEVRLMFPMITTLEELHRVRKLVSGAKQHAFGQAHLMHRRFSFRRQRTDRAHAPAAPPPAAPGRG